VRFCTLLRGEPDAAGVLRDVELIDVSVVDDGHITGRDEDGLWHIPGGALRSLDREPGEAP
jgi:hypothetical protein